MDASNLQFSTDYSNDFIVGMWEGSFNVPSSTTPTSINISHNLSFIPLAKGGFSTSPDFNPTNEIGSTTILYGISVPIVQLAMSMNINTISLTSLNRTGSSVTVYYRIYAFMPSDINEDVPDLSTDRASILFNSDETYLKVLMSGFVPISSTPVTVEHGLGYIPYVEAWGGSSSGKYPLPLVFYPIGTYGRSAVTANEQTVTFYPDSFGGSERYDYRIYLDD